MRYAVYYSPPARDPLTALAARWLGRDAFAGTACSHPVVAGLSTGEIEALTRAPRRYGFHATLRAPFAPAGGVDEDMLVARLGRIASRLEPVFVPGLKVREIDGFFALTPSTSVPDLDRLAETVVRDMHDCAAPPDAAALARRRAAGLTPRQDALLRAWGYPYVMDEFAFHMSLTGPVPPPEQARLRSALDTLFAPLARPPVLVDRLQLFLEPEPGAAFVVRAEIRLGAARAAARKGAA